MDYRIVALLARASLLVVGGATSIADLV